jgi:type VI secretion system protein ImpJ
MIHWHEGLFLQPHHLQTQQRGIYKALYGERRFSMTFPYGVIEARLAVDDLEDHRVRFDRLHVALPGGAIFRYPEDAELPSLDIKAAFRDRGEDFMIYLAVPVWLDERPNAIEFGTAAGPRQKIIYQVAESEVCDENTGRNKQPMQVRRLNGMLMFEDDDFSDCEYIPLLRVMRQVSDAAGMPRMNPRYVPPTLLLRGAPPLMQLVRDLTSQIAATRDQLAAHLANTPLDLRSLQGMQFEQLARLRCLHRSAGQLMSLVDTAEGRVPPFEVYLELRSLLNELEALYPARAEWTCSPYNHDNPWPPFQELDTKIRSYLGGVVKPRYRKIEFRFADGLFTGDMDPGFFQDATGFYLSVETATDPASLVRLMEDSDHFKLMPASFGIRAIRGLALKEERHPPFELPVKARTYYYRLNLDASRRIWEQFVREPQAIIHFEAPDRNRFAFTLYATVPAPLG